MPRLPRVHIQKRPLMELGNRVCQGFDLLDLDADFTASVVGILAKAQMLFGMELHGGAVMSDHFHLIASPEDVEQQAAFMGFFTRRLSQLAGRRHDWDGSMFPQRYNAMEISSEPAAQAARLKYVLSNGCKEGLVASPLEWPGVPFADAMVGDGVLKGTWVDREALYEARRRGEVVSEEDFAEEVELVLSPLPCWAHMSTRAYGAVARSLIDAIERETAAMHEADGTRPVGPRRLLEAQGRRGLRPRKLERRPCPWIFGRSLEVVQALMEGLKQKVVAYRTASELLRSGFRQVRFPENCFPPALPFVPYAGVPVSGVPGRPEKRARGDG